MNKRLQDLAVLLYELPEWLVIRSLTITSPEGVRKVAIPLEPGQSLPVPDGSFTLTVEAGPERESASPSTAETNPNIEVL